MDVSIRTWTKRIDDEGPRGASDGEDEKQENEAYDGI
jgi:hypothetical protein